MSDFVVLREDNPRKEALLDSLKRTTLTNNSKQHPKHVILLKES